MEFPIVKKVSAKMVAEELIPVMPMSAPTYTASYMPNYTSNSIVVDVWDENIFDQELTLEELSDILRQRVRDQVSQVEGEIAPVAEIAPFTGTTYMSTGYVYAPYIPAITTTTIENFEPKEVIKSRYAVKSVDPKFYGLLNIE